MIAMRPAQPTQTQARVRCRAMRFAQDEQHLSGEEEHPNGEDDGVDVNDDRRRGLFVEISAEVEAEAQEDSNPQGAEVNGRWDAVFAGGPRSADVKCSE